MKARDISGQVFSKSDDLGNVCSLTVIQRSTSDRHGLRWMCLCTCGETISVYGHNLVSGRQVSCGCYNDKRKRSAIKHGHARKDERSSEYTSWHMMIQRCTNPKSTCYEDYGGRGISVHKPWLKFENFLADMGKKSNPKLTIERRNVNGNYEPSNCYWATRKQQRANQRCNATY